jgi:hypothetical protein
MVVVEVGAEIIVIAIIEVGVAGQVVVGVVGVSVAIGVGI